MPGFPRRATAEGPCPGSVCYFPIQDPNMRLGSTLPTVVVVHGPSSNCVGRQSNRASGQQRQLFSAFCSSVLPYYVDSRPLPPNYQLCPRCKYLRLAAHLVCMYNACLPVLDRELPVASPLPSLPVTTSTPSLPFPFPFLYHRYDTPPTRLHTLAAQPGELKVQE